MPTIDEVTQMLSKMDRETYGAAVKFIYYLASNQQKENPDISQQRKFIEETVGKVSVDEDAVNSLRMGSMI